MGIDSCSADHPGYLADKYLGTKFDIIANVSGALPWLSEVLSEAQTTNENVEIISGYSATLMEMFGGIDEINAAATEVRQAQQTIDASIFDMAYNLIRTQAIVAKYHAFE